MLRAFSRNRLWHQHRLASGRASRRSHRQPWSHEARFHADVVGADHSLTVPLAARTAHTTVSGDRGIDVAAALAVVMAVAEIVAVITALAGAEIVAVAVGALLSHTGQGWQCGLAVGRAS